MVKLRTGLLRTAAAIAALTLILGSAGPRAAFAEIIVVPPADPPDSPGSLPSPTVLRGSPPSAVSLVPVCPPGYTLSLEHNCVAPSGGDYTDYGPGYDYWPDYGYGYPFGGFSGFGFNRGHPHRFARFQGGRSFHGRAGFHGTAKFATHGAGVAPMGGGFGHR